MTPFQSLLLLVRKEILSADRERAIRNHAKRSHIEAELRQINKTILEG